MTLELVKWPNLNLNLARIDFRPVHQYLTVYSPKLPLTSGGQFSAVLTEPKTYRATLDREYVFVYIND